MSELFRAHSGADLYMQLRDALLERGREVSPRGQKTLELPAVTMVIEDPTQAAPVGLGRKLTPKIGAAEATNLIGAFSDANLLINCAKNFAMFVEGPSGDRLMGAYGPRARGQWQRVVQQLAQDHDTRQAGLNIWRYDELAVPSKDVPCTLSLYYMLRDGKLEAFTTMRSNDLVWGTSYDWMQFTAAQRALAFSLGVELGPYTHHAYSLHAYVERDDISTWRSGQEPEFEQPTPYTYGTGEVLGEEEALSRWNWIADDFMEIALPGWGGTYDTPLAHGWYRDVLDGTQSGARLCSGCWYALPDVEAHFARPTGECRVCEKES